jgi:hypothetical protein
MNRVQALRHKGKSIILVDLSHCTPNESLEAIPNAQEVIAKAGPKNALVMTDVTEATYNQAVAAAIKSFVQVNTPYMKGSAVVGADGVRLILLNTVIFLTRRELKTFKTRIEAQDWLASIP